MVDFDNVNQIKHSAVSMMTFRHFQIVSRSTLTATESESGNIDDRMQCKMAGYHSALNTSALGSLIVPSKMRAV